MLSREGKQTDRGAVGAEFIGYNRRRREALLLQEFPHQPNCRPSVPAGLNQEIQDFALTVHGTPEIELPPSNYDDHLVQVPAFGRSWPPTLNPPRIGPTEFQDPSSNCLIRDVEGGTRRTRVEEGSAAMRLNSIWPEWVIRQGNACVWVQAPSAEVAVKFVTERAGPMGGWRTGPGVEQEVLPRAKYSEHAMPPDARSMWSRHEGRPAA